MQSDLLLRDLFFGCTCCCQVWAIHIERSEVFGVWCKLSLGIFDEAISNHRCFDDFVWEGESHECEQVNHTMKMTSMWVHVGDWFLFPWRSRLVLHDIFPRVITPGSIFFRNHVDTSEAMEKFIPLNKFEALHSWKIFWFATKESLRDSYEAFPKDAKGNLPPHQALPALARAYFAKVSFGGG